MKKPGYQEILDESELIAMHRKRRSIMINVTLALTLFCIYYLFKLYYFLAECGFEFVVVVSITIVLAMFMILVMTIINYIKFHVSVTRLQISSAIKQVLLKREDEYLEEMNDCSDHVSFLKESIDIVKGELEISRENCTLYGDDYMKDITECVERHGNLEKLLPDAQTELEVATSNLKEFSTVKKTINEWWK